jgi:hypothetical protein
MTLLDDFPRSSFRSARRHEIVTVGGMDAVLRVGDALRCCGYPVRDFSVEVHDGVPYSSVTCTVSLSAAESCAFTSRIGALSEVLSVEPR